MTPNVSLPGNRPQWKYSVIYGCSFAALHDSEPNIFDKTLCTFKMNHNNTLNLLYDL